MSKKAPLFSFKYILYDFVKWFASWQVLLFYRIRLYYDTKEAAKAIKGGAIIVSNHVGFSDPFVLQCCFAYRRFHFLAMEELFEKKFTAWIYKHVFLTAPISRSKPSIKVIKDCSTLAENGNIVCLFPEGHINVQENTVDPFKGGAILMAYKAGVPIVPVYHKKRTSIWHKTRVAIGKPFNVKEFIGPVCSQNKINEASAKLHEYETFLMTLIKK